MNSTTSTSFGRNDYVMEEFSKVTEDQDALSKEILSESIKEIAGSTVEETSTNTLMKIEETSEKEEEPV